MEMNDLVKVGKLEPEDKIALRRCNSLKQAYSLMKVLTRRRKKEMAEAQMASVQQTAQVQQQSNEQAHQNNVGLKQVEIQGDLAIKEAERILEREKHKYKMEQLALMIQLQNQGKIEEEVVSGEYDLKKTNILAKQKTDDRKRAQAKA
jgi:hypothetical protein